MVLACQNISKSFGTESVLKHVSFHIEENEKAAVVGINGAGKTTLLRIIMDEIRPDEGTVTIAKDKTIGYLAQHQQIDVSNSIYHEVLEGKRALIDLEDQIKTMEDGLQSVPQQDMDAYMEKYHRLLHEFEAKDGYAYRSEVSGVLKGLGFTEEEFNKPCNELSGGQKTRVALARLLVTHPDIILLDEPTNHLDIESISWLETFLLNYKGAVILVAHDRYFLDRIVTRVIEISMHESAVYPGNYSDYAKKAEKVREDKMKAWYNQQREIHHQEQVIEKLRSFNREKSIRRAESREKQLAKIEVLDKPVSENTKMQITLTPSIISGNDVLSVEHLSKSYPDKELFHDIGFEIRRGERVALIGQNGTGKTTILKILNQMVEADSGEIRLGTNVKIGYYDQEHQVLHMDKTLIEEISDDYPDLTNTRIRNLLAAFLFTQDDVFKRVSDLSGGERGRLSLARLMLSEANFLILDEPTNHLDIVSKEILESAMNRYEGTVLFVSHDRYFINQTATRILNLTGNSILNYQGNYDYYLEKKDVTEKAYLQNNRAEQLQSAPIRDTESKQDWKERKEEQAKQRKLQNRIQKLEERIEELEDRLSRIDSEFMKPEVATNSARLNELHAEQTEISGELEQLYAQWEELSE